MIDQFFRIGVAGYKLLFDGWRGPPETVPGGYLEPPLVETYFGRATGAPRPGCASAARAAGKSAGTTGRLCPPGAFARIEGGEPCEESPGSLDASALACGDGVDDLALALAGHRPSTVFVTRFSGRVPAGSIGEDDALTSTTVRRSLVQTASRYETCSTPRPELRHRRPEEKADRRPSDLRPRPRSTTDRARRSDSA